MCAASTLEVCKNMFSSTSKYSAPTLGEDKNMFARFYQNKCSKFLIIFLSKVVVKRDTGYAKYKRWTQKRSKVKMRKRKRNENKDNPCSRKKYSTREKYISESIVELG